MRLTPKYRERKEKTEFFDCPYPECGFSSEEEMEIRHHYRQNHLLLKTEMVRLSTYSGHVQFFFLSVHTEFGFCATRNGCHSEQGSWKGPGYYDDAGRTLEDMIKRLENEHAMARALSSVAHQKLAAFKANKG